MQEEDNLTEVKRRLEVLENSQKPTVDSALEQLQMFIRAPSFSKERALDYLISLKVVAKEASHQKSGFYGAVLPAMQEKTYVSNYQFKLYLRTLLDDKDDDTVLDSMAKVEKAMKASTPRPFRGRGRGRVNRASARCYACGQVGH